MGIADYGVSGYGHPTDYAYGTTAFLGTINWTNAYIYSASQGGDFSIQLNVVLNFINGGKNYSYWIQNVPVPVDTTKNDFQMSYADNIWNFSCASSTCNLATNTVTGNGTDSGGVYVWPKSANSGCAGGGSVPCDTLDGPSWTSVEVRSFLNPSGVPEVRFCYFDKLNPALQCYDTVTFGFAKHVTLDRGFFVDGFTMNPTGLFEDAELTIGGPGNGASTTNTGPSNIHMTLDYWNGHNFQSVPSAWNAGDDTAEALSSDQSVFSNDGSGTPLTVQLNGTTREDFENPSYTLNQVGTLQVVASGMTSGRIVVRSAGWDYQGGEADLTLVPGTYHVWDNGTTSYDLGMCTIAAATVLTVTLPSTCSVSNILSISSFTATPNPVTQGSSVTFNVATSGGIAPLTHAYSGLPPGCTSSNTSSLTCTPTAAGTYQVNATVNDSGTAHVSKVIALIVSTSTPLSITTFTASPNPVTLGSSVTFTVSATGGSPAYTYAYSGLPAGCTSSNASSFSCTPTSAGSFNVNATVNDTAGGHVYKVYALTVSSVPPPTISSFTVLPSPVAVNNQITLTTTVTGGAAPLTYSYTGLPAGCTSQDAATMTCTPTAAGSYTINVTVTDANLKTASSTASLTVVSPLTISAFSANPSSFYIGSSTTLSVTAAGGQAPLAYAYSGLPTGCASTNTVTLSCTPTAAGNYTVTVTVSDASSKQATTTTILTVLSLPTITSFTSSPSPAVQYSPTTFTVQVTGGAKPYSYAYTGLPTGCSSQDQASFTCAPGASGSFTVHVTVTDAGSKSTSTTLALTVSAAPSPTISSFTATPNSLTIGGNTTLAVSASGGTGPLSYSYSNLPDGCTTLNVSTLTCTPTVAGTFTITVTVTDVHHMSASQSVTFTVNLQGTSGGLLGNTSLLLLILIVAIVVVIAVVLLARRKKPEPTAPPVAPWPYPAYAMEPSQTSPSAPQYAPEQTSEFGSMPSAGELAPPPPQ
jgi:hypothetical protein